MMKGKRRSSPHICSGSREDALHNLATLQAGEADATAATDDGEVFVIEAKQVQDRGMQITEMYRAIDDGAAVVICFAVRVTGLHTAASHPECERAVLMPGLIFVLAWLKARTAKLTTPDDKGVIEQTAFIQIIE
jgi:hypothetical protein